MSYGELCLRVRRRLDDGRLPLAPSGRVDPAAHDGVFGNKGLDVAMRQARTSASKSLHRMDGSAGDATPRIGSAALDSLANQTVRVFG
jgi:hypothetical protein